MHYKESTFNGCLDPTTLQTDKILVILISGGNTPTLSRNTIKDLTYLKELTIGKNNIETVEKGAFVNVANLKSLAIYGNRISEIPQYFFSGLHVTDLIISDNGIEILSGMAFHNMTKFQRIVADSNKIGQYNIEWFQDSPNLHTIEFHYNSIRIIPRKAFRFNKKLELINFQGNMIDTIEDDAFYGLTSLSTLILRYNRIKIINLRAFPSTRITISAIYIDANKLNYLQEEFFDRVTLKFEIYLNGNPWLCSCLNRLSNYLLSHKIKHNAYFLAECAEFPKCVNPVTINNCTDEYDEESTKYFYDNVVSKRQLAEKNICIRYD